MRISVTLSANAGTAIDMGGRRIWVDALHEEKQPSFSAVELSLQRKMLTAEAFQNPQYICYTHCHGDHYSQRLTDAAMKLWPKAKVLSPEGKYRTFEGDAFTVEDEGLQIRYVKLPHEGEQYRDVVHFGIFLTYKGKTILIPGDCETASPILAQALEGQKVDLALLDFPWMALRKGKEFVEKHLPQAQLALYHIPFEGDDTAGYREGARRAVRGTEISLLMEPLQQIVFEL